MKKTSFYLCAAVALLLMSCSDSDDAVVNGSDENTSWQSVLTVNEQQMVAHTGDFAFRLLSTEGKAANGGSCVVSPLSAGFLLGMLSDGARGETQREIVGALGLGDYDAATVRAFFSRLSGLVERADGEVTVSTPSALFFNTSGQCRLVEAYTAGLESDYRATVARCDFGRSDETLAAINSWASDATSGLIPSLMTTADFNPTALFCLLNAVTFDAQWVSPFPEMNTHEGTFRIGDGHTVQIPLMESEAGEVPFMESSDVAAISLPYNGDYSMVVALPRGGQSVATMASQLGSGLLQQLTEQMENVPVHVTLPRFSTESTTDLKVALQEMGVNRAFTGEADFSGMLGSDFKGNFAITVKQKERIDVTEKGTKGAAVTHTAMVTLPEPDSQVKRFEATMPFVYAIVEHSTGAVLFTGIFSGR